MLSAEIGVSFYNHGEELGLIRDCSPRFPSGLTELFRPSQSAAIEKYSGRRGPFLLRKQSRESSQQVEQLAVVEPGFIVLSQFDFDQRVFLL
jgi:hypothetical protein